jgi:AcrR family transcriptional regulator
MTNKGATKLHRSERREDIIRGAARAFVKNGYEATSLEDIAQAAEVSRALLYRHFTSKKELYIAILESFRNRLLVISPDAEPQRTGRIDELIAVAQADPDGFRLVFRHAAREPEFRSYSEDLHTRRVQYINKNLQPRIADAKQRRFVAALLQDVVIGTLLTWVDSGMPNPQQIPGMLQGIIAAVVQPTAKK